MPIRKALKKTGRDCEFIGIITTERVKWQNPIKELVYLMNTKLSKRS